MSRPLHSLGGQLAPPELGADLARLLRLPMAAQGQIWQVLGPCLDEKLGDDTERLLDVFCAAHRVPEADLALAVKACRFLLVAAAKLDVSDNELGDDLTSLCGDAVGIKELLLPGYGPAKKQIRRALTTAALVGHGKLLVGAEWRLDVIQASDRAAKLQLPVTMLTLHYKEGDKTERITLQALPDVVAQLKTMCEQVLG